MTTKFPQTQPTVSQVGRGNTISVMDQDQILAPCGLHHQSKVRQFRPRHLHESTLSLGSMTPCYTTTHNQSFSGRSADGRPLDFRLRDPSFPSQHRSQLDLTDGSDAPRSALLTHTGEVHGPKHITVRADPKKKNWALYRSGHDVREITNPRNPTEYQTTYRTVHSSLESGDSSLKINGRPIQWHQHDILTGERKQSVGSAKSWRRTRDELLWPAKRWDTDCGALRLC